MIGLACAIAVAQTVEMPDTARGSLRTRAMGGASIGVAEGASSVPDNPAAMAIRRSFLARERTDLDASIQLGAHPWLTAGRERVLGTVPLPRARARWRLGVGARVDRLGSSLAVAEQSFDGDSGRWVARTFSAGVGGAGSTWAVGVTPTLVQFRRDLGGAVGGGATVGGLWAPRRTPFRVGARIRTPTRTAPLADGSRLWQPFEAGAGVSVVLGAVNQPDRFGPGLLPDRARGSRVLLALDVVATGGGSDAVALWPLLDNGSASPVGGPTGRARAGIEWATLRDRLRLRAGVASVPARGARAGVRAGVGAGFEIFEALGLSYRLAGYVGLGPEGWTGGLGGETW